jgi:hypothetical protein
MRASGWAGLLAAAAVVAGVAGCGSAGGQAPATGSSSGAGGSTPARSASISPSPSPAAPGTTAGTQPQGGPVPVGFAATSVTFVSPDEAFVLGTAPCAQAPCTSIVRTLDRGASWIGLPAPVVPVGEPAISSAPVVWGIRFATPEIGFVFGDGLWQTTDGGEHWTRDPAAPHGSILSLAIVQGQVLVLTARCTAGGCEKTGLLSRRPLGGGPWAAVIRPTIGNLIDPDDLIDTQAGVAAVVVGNDVLVTPDGGLTYTLHRVPCAPLSGLPSVAVTSATGGLVALCTDQGYTGHTIKQIFVSDDDGASWTQAGAPSPDGDGGTLAASPAGNVAIATASAASWLFYSADGGMTWRIVNEQLDGGAGWADLGFTTDTDGVVVRGPAVNDGNTQQRPGQLFLTSDGGAAWYQVTF